MKILQSRMKTVHTFVRKVSLPLSRGPVRDPTKVPLSCSPQVPKDEYRSQSCVLTRVRNPVQGWSEEVGREGKGRRDKAMAMASSALLFSPCFPYPTKLCGVPRICISPVASLFSEFSKNSESRSFILNYRKVRLHSSSSSRSSLNVLDSPLRSTTESELSSLVCFSGAPEEDGASSGVVASEATMANGVEELEQEAALREEGDRPRARKSGGATRVADSTDWIASSLTRRFGLGAGLAWVGVLAFGVVSEQIKTRTEVFLEEQGTR